MTPRNKYLVAGFLLSSLTVPTVSFANYKTLANATNEALHLNITTNQPEEIKDPWIRFNRKVFAFNDTLDKYTLLPVARIYHKVTPNPVDKGVTNFFRNIKEPWSAINHLLQGHPVNAGKSLARFALNTMTSLGFYDLAKQQGLTTTREDFGQTLAAWGMPSGPYLMLPIFGPSTIRDSIGLVADTSTSPMSEVKPTSAYFATSGVQIVDIRADLIPFEQVLQGDRYVLVRDFWMQQRQAEISNGKVSETAPIDQGFGDDEGSSNEPNSDTNNNTDTNKAEGIDSTQAAILETNTMPAENAAPNVEKDIVVPLENATPDEKSIGTHF